MYNETAILLRFGGIQDGDLEHFGFHSTVLLLVGAENRIAHGLLIGTFYLCIN